MTLPPQIIGRIETAFWSLDDIVVAMAPDAPADVMEAWSALRKLLPEETIKRRDQVRGVS